jgi:nicotinamidase-related amidase
MTSALLIIDVQNDYFAGGKSELHRPLDALSNIERVLEIFRAQKWPVIHVQHLNTRPSASFFIRKRKARKSTPG